MGLIVQTLSVSKPRNEQSLEQAIARMFEPRKKDHGPRMTLSQQNRFGGSVSARGGSAPR